MKLIAGKIGTQSYTIGNFPFHMLKLIQISEWYEESKSLNAGCFWNGKSNFNFSVLSLFCTLYVFWAVINHSIPIIILCLKIVSVFFLLFGWKGKNFLLDNNCSFLWPKILSKCQSWDTVLWNRCFPIHMTKLIQFSKWYGQTKRLNLVVVFERKNRISNFVFIHCFAL